jgi:hypothetical protein
MANPTSNFGWQMPTNTDLVKDLPADFEVFGQAVDTDLADLKGGTTGQVLSKTSNTDLDFTWTTPNVGDITEVQAGTGISVASGTGPIPVITNTVATEFDSKGDLIVGTGADTFDRLAVGTDGYTLVADSAETLGVKWAAISSPTNDYQLLNAGGTALTGATTITVNITAYNNLLIRWDFASASASSVYGVRFNSDTGNNYYWAGLKLENTTVYKDGPYSNELFVGSQGNVGTDQCSGSLIVHGAKATGFKPYTLASIGTGTTNSNSVSFNGFYKGTSAITSISFLSSSGNFDNGTLYIYGAD